jgi:hypothetical protein
MLVTKRKSGDGLIGYLDERISVLESQRDYIKSLVEDMPRAEEANRLAALTKDAKKLLSQLEQGQMELEELVGSEEVERVVAGHVPKTEKRAEILLLKKYRR